MEGLPSSMDALSLKVFECPVCMEYFQKPIMQCPTGHSICAVCKSKIEKCPYCNQQYAATRNFALETILMAIQVECKHEHCTKVIPLHMYAQHANQCPFRNVKCKRTNCTWADNKLLVIDHIKSNHASLVVNKYERLLSHQMTESFIEHNHSIFYVHRYVEDKFMLWTAEPTVNMSVHNLCLVVKVVSPTGTWHIIREPIMPFGESSERNKEKATICFLKSKIKGCEFQLSIEENN